jgi:hypothetical protein
MPTLAPPKPSPTTPVRRMHRWACTVWCGTDYELRVEVFAVDREAARDLAAMRGGMVSLADVLVRYVSTVPMD